MKCIQKGLPNLMQCPPGHIVYQGIMPTRSCHPPGHSVNGAKCHPGHSVSGAQCFQCIVFPGYSVHWGMLSTSACVTGEQCLMPRCLRSQCLSEVFRLGTSRLSQSSKKKFGSKKIGPKTFGYLDYLLKVEDFLTAFIVQEVHSLFYFFCKYQCNAMFKFELM